MISIKEDKHSWHLNPKRFSSWGRFTKVQAWVHRFTDNCRLQKRERAELKPSEIEDAEIQAIKSTQWEAFPEQYSALHRQKGLPKNSKLLGLKPRLDEEGLIRCDGRLKYSQFLSPDARFPILQPRENQVTKLIVKHYYEEGKDASGTNQTLAALSTRFWIIYGRETSE